jgi:hypothetical protein
MESATKPAHRLSIWNLVNPPTSESQGRSPDKAPAQMHVSGGEQLGPATRALSERRRRSLPVRPSVRPFAAKCLLPNGAKLSCETKRIEPERIEVAYKENGKANTDLPLNIKVGLDLDFFGFVRGTVSDSHKSGFAIAPDIIYHETLVAKLAELYAPDAASDNSRGNLARLMARITLRDPACIYRLIDGDATLYYAKIALLSHKVATLRTAHIQRAGTRLLLGRADAHAGTVVRSFESGFTVEFDELLEELHEHLTFG